MTGTLGGMIDAAMLAREATVKVGVIERDVEIVVTELGFIIRGRVRIGSAWVHKSETLDWAEFIANPILLANSVGLVVGALSAKEEREAAFDRDDSRRP